MVPRDIEGTGTTVVNPVWGFRAKKIPTLRGDYSAGG